MPIDIFLLTETAASRSVCHIGYLTIRPVALEGEGFNCFSITQLVRQKRQS